MKRPVKHSDGAYHLEGKTFKVLTGSRQQVWNKVQEELIELKFEVDKGDEQKTTEEFGDLIFSLINYARFVNVNPEDALEKTKRNSITSKNILTKLNPLKSIDDIKKETKFLNNHLIPLPHYQLRY